MIVKPALAAMLASGLVAPERPALILPKPAIVRAESLEFSKHMLLGMPITMGMLPGKAAGGPYYIGNPSGSSAASASSRSWSHTTTAATNCLVILGYCNNNAGSALVSTATFDGVSMTRVVRTNVGSQGNIALFVLFDPPIGTYTAVMTATGGDRGICASAMNIGGATAVNVSGVTNQTTSSTITTTLTSTARGLPVAATSTNIAGSTTITHTFTSPSGQFAAHTHSFLSNSNRKFTTLSCNLDLFDAGSISHSVLDNVTAAGRHQAFMILA